MSAFDYGDGEYAKVLHTRRQAALEYAKVLHAREQAALEYAALALWDRKPVEDQGDTSEVAHQARRDLMEEAGDRWAELNVRVKTMWAQYDRERVRCR